MSIFGWSMPAGAWDSILPGEEPEMVPPRCGCCGAFLPWEPDERVPWDDPPYAAGFDLVWDCRRCGKRVWINDMDLGCYGFDGKAEEVK